ncbi:MAG: hypothetical protein H0V23_08845 [Nocardioidaceae bacterium]|nr:hypothetical protein [Nocardioidaceae bacterium]
MTTRLLRIICPRQPRGLAFFDELCRALNKRDDLGVALASCSGPQHVARAEDGESGQFHRAFLLRIDDTTELAAVSAIAAPAARAPDRSVDPSGALLTTGSFSLSQALFLRNRIIGVPLLRAVPSWTLD